MGMLHLFGNSFDHSNTGKNKIYIPVKVIATLPLGELNLFGKSIQYVDKENKQLPSIYWTSNFHKIYNSSS